MTERVIPAIAAMFAFTCFWTVAIRMCFLLTAIRRDIAEIRRKALGDSA